MKEKEDGSLEGIKISLPVRISHLHFVDDVLLFEKGYLAEWKEYNDILYLFKNDSSMEISGTKSKFLNNGLEGSLSSLDQDYFPP